MCVQVFIKEIPPRDNTRSWKHNITRVKEQYNGADDVFLVVKEAVGEAKEGAELLQFKACCADNLLEYNRAVDWQLEPVRSTPEEVDNLVGWSACSTVRERLPQSRWPSVGSRY